MKTNFKCFALFLSLVIITSVFSCKQTTGGRTGGSGVQNPTSVEKEFPISVQFNVGGTFVKPYYHFKYDSNYGVDTLSNLKVTLCDGKGKELKDYSSVTWLSGNTDMRITPNVGYSVTLQIAVNSGTVDAIEAGSYSCTITAKDIEQNEIKFTISAY